MVTSCYQSAQIIDQKCSGWEDEAKVKLSKIKQITYKIQFLNWEFKNYIQFTKKYRTIAEKKEEILFKLLEGLLSMKHGKLEEIRKAQFEFNDAVRLAHAELLTISPNASSKSIVPN